MSANVYAVNTAGALYRYNTSTNVSTSLGTAATVGRFLAINAAETEIWVSTYTNNSVVVWNIAGGAVTHTITMTANVYQLGFSNDGTVCYAVVSGVGIVPINTSTYTAGTTLTLTSGPGQVPIGMNPGANSLIAITAANTAQQMALPGGGLSPALAGSGTPYNICFKGGTGTYAYVVKSTNVQSINVAGNSVIANITPSGSPTCYGCSATPDGTRIWVSAQSGKLFYIDTSVNTVLNLSTFNTGGTGNAYGNVITSDGSKLCVADEAAGSLYVMNLPGVTLSHTFGLTGNVFDIATVPAPAATSAEPIVMIV